MSSARETNLFHYSNHTGQSMLTRNAEMIVVTEAPINPSQVFFGDSLIKGVFPKKNPKIYAAISLITISVAGRRNLNPHLKIGQVMI